MDEFDELFQESPGKGNRDLDLDLIVDPSLTGTAREELLTNLHQREASGFTITVRQKYLVQGTYTGNTNEPATLLGLQFELRKTAKGKHRRFRYFKVALRFERDPWQLPSDDPFVKSYAPAQLGDIYLLPTEVHISEEITKKAGLEAKKDPVPLSAVLEIEKKKGKEWDQLRKATISAQAYKTELRGGGRLGEDKIEWTVTENDKQESIPDTFVVAVVLRRTGDSKFKVHFDIKADIDFWYGLEVFWQKVKDKTTIKTFKGVREASKVFESTEQGEEPPKPKEQDKEPPNTDIKNNLRAFALGNELDKLVWHHLPEFVAPVCFYKDGRDAAIVTQNTPPSGSDQGAEAPLENTGT